MFSKRLLLLITVLPLVESVCVSPWVENGNYCYLFHNITSTLYGHSFDAAETICNRYGGNLLKIENQIEQTYINTFFNDPSIKKQHYWIGLNDKETEGVYTWTDGTKLNPQQFSNWRTSTGEPSNYNNEDCVEVHWEGKWNDNDCLREFGFICKKNKDAVPPITPSLPPPPNVTMQPTTCEAGWIPWGTSCYGFIKGLEKTFKDARADCLRRFGDLVIVNTTGEQLFLTVQTRTSNSDFWIGLSDEYKEGQFFWVNREELSKSMTFWGKGEPSNFYGNEDCVAMYGKYNPGQWNDDHCSALHDYICEKQSGTHNCPEGWITYGDNCYEINAHPNQRASWNNSRRHCLDFNKAWKESINVAEADLVSVTSRDEEIMLMKAFRQNGATDRGSSFWTGLNSMNIRNEFIWSDGSQLTYAPWKGATTGDGKCVKHNMDGDGGWIKSDCNEKNFFACKIKRGQDRCYDPVGIQDYRIPDSSFTASGQLSMATPPAAARLYKASGGGLDGGWCEANTTKDPWLQVDLGRPERLTYMGVQGKSNSDALVLAFFLKYSDDGTSWNTYGDIPPNHYYKFLTWKNWRENTDTVMNLPLPSPFVARFVRIYPLEWHEACCMRIEFYGCPQESTSKKCGLGWVEDKKTQNCYHFSSQKTTWDASQSICATQGAELSSITSYDENRFIIDQLRGLSGKYYDYWIGLNDLDYEGVFRWSDQSPLVVSYWYKDNPKQDTARENCVAARSEDGYWTEEDCSSFRNYICKRQYWKSGTNFYWPLNTVSTNNMVDGTQKASGYGNFTTENFPVPFDSETNLSREALSFNGRDNFVKIPYIDGSCVSDPDADHCVHGITVSFLFKYTQPTSLNTNDFLLDTIGHTRSEGGYYVSITMSRISAYVQGRRKYYTAATFFNSKTWNHFAFTWSASDGLQIFLNGKQSGSHRFGSSHGTDVIKVGKNPLFIGRSKDTEAFTKMYFTSLAIYERVLDQTDIESIYAAEYGRCKWGQIPLGSYCYEFNSMSLKWSDASSACQSNGGQLMSIHSPDEQALLTTSAAILKNIWIGLNSLQTNNVYNWTDGAPVSFTYWASREPNNWGSRREDCVNTFSSGLWNDELCYYAHPYACKYSRDPYVPRGEITKEPTNLILYYYQRRTFGCPLSYRIKLLKVIYGSIKDGCTLDEALARSIVEKSCTGPRCTDVQASNRYFNDTDPCKDKTVYSTNKVLNITYTCEKDGGYFYSSDCPTGYQALKGGDVCFKLYLQELSIEDAQAQCKSDQATIISISSMEEQLLLTTMLSELYKPSDIWIGLKYDDITQMYSWINGRPLLFTNWFNKQPDPRYGPYVKMSLKEGAYRFLFWRQANGSEQLPFFCRKLKVKATEEPAVATTLRPNGTCPQNWTKSNNYCYYLNADQMSFNEAHTACSKLGENAELASIHSNEENQVIFDMFQKSKFPFAWFGLSNEAVLRGFEWIDDTPVSYINWYTDRPNTGLRHLCAGMRSDGYWEDLACHSKYPSICKAPVGQVYVPTTTIAPATTTTQDPSLCGSKDWVFFNNSCYFFSNNTGLDWHQASVACQNMNNSRLASILNPSENTFLTDKINRLNWNQHAYIGLTDRTEESGWVWGDGSVVSYINFDVDQPDNWHGMEDCVELRTNGKWNDMSCNIIKPFICKRKTGEQTLPTVNPTAQPDGGYCPNGWKLYGRKCYLFMLDQKQFLTYEGASSYCKDFKDGDLVSIHSNFENAFILSQLSDMGNSIFIGLSDRQTEGLFLWNDQTSVDYTNWYLRQPSRYGNEDCVEMLPFFQHHGQWNDIGCDKQTGFVCQTASSSVKPTGATTSAPKSQCPKDYLDFKSNCYLIRSTPKTWGDALQECEKQDDGNLLSLHDPYEQAFVFSHFAQAATETWIGLHKGPSDTEWKWSDNTAYDYKYWTSYSSYGNRCVKQTNNGKWQAENCSATLPFACKITLTGSEKTPSFIGNCTEGWTKIGSMCYKYFDQYSEVGRWSEAREKCKSFGGNLAKVHNKETQFGLQYLIRDSWRPAWLGLNDRRKEHVFEWSDGTPLLPDDFTNWNWNEPNDNSGEENCVEMMSTTGKWNDLDCSKKQPYICEHPLECRQALGMENKKIPDSSITATSYAGSFFPRNARVNLQDNNEQTAWCTNITDREQSLTIDLGDLVTVTRISTQGLQTDKQSSRVISYLLKYSVDGVNWIQYQEYENGQLITRFLPGNQQSRSIEGTTVNVKATHLRFIPKTFSGTLVCLRLELYGCKSLCSKPLGVSNHAIQRPQLSVSSNVDAIDGVRLLAKQPWCSTLVDNKPWIKIDLLQMMQVTRVSVTGRDFTYYYVSFNDVSDAKLWQRSQTLQGRDKRFSVNQPTHDLELRQVSRYVMFEFVSEETAVCAQVEIFGCTFECDNELNVKPRMVSASTEIKEFEASKAFTSQEDSAWCATTNDNSQFLQIDFGQRQGLTSISTQGLIRNSTDVKWVKRYFLQWSDDGNFWHQVTTEFSGSFDGINVQKNHFENAIYARFLRVIPTAYENGLCLRLKLYGCPQDGTMPTRQPTTAPKKKAFTAAIRLTSETFTNELQSVNSPEHLQLKEKLENAIEKVYIENDEFYKVTVTGFRPGSVVCTFEIMFYAQGLDEENVFDKLKDKIKEGKLEGFEVDPDYFKTESGGTSNNKNKQVSDASGLSKSGKIGLIIFFVLVILIIVIIGVIYFRRNRNGFKLQFPHKSFSNPVHMTPSADEDDDQVQFVNEDDLNYL